MGREKQALEAREQNAKDRAHREGDLCGYDGSPLLTAEEKVRGYCDRCEYMLNKD